MEQKSPDAFRTISEVADWLGVPTHVLRFWESRFTQVKPVKRAGGRRYYRPADMQLLGGIRKLLHDDGMTIRGVQKLLREQGIKHVSAMSPPLDMDGEDGSIASNVVSLEATRASDADAEPQAVEEADIVAETNEPEADVEVAETAPDETSEPEPADDVADDVPDEEPNTLDADTPSFSTQVSEVKDGEITEVAAPDPDLSVIEEALSDSADDDAATDTDTDDDGFPLGTVVKARKDSDTPSTDEAAELDALQPDPQAPHEHASDEALFPHDPESPVSDAVSDSDTETDEDAQDPVDVEAAAEDQTDDSDQDDTQDTDEDDAEDLSSDAIADAIAAVEGSEVEPIEEEAPAAPALVMPDIGPDPENMDTVAPAQIAKRLRELRKSGRSLASDDIAPLADRLRALKYNPAPTDAELP